MYVVNKQLDSAIVVYDFCFENYSKRHYKDLHNACICAINLKKFNLAYKYALELIKCGYQIDDYELNGFLPLKKTHFWKRLKKDIKNKQHISLNDDQENLKIEIQKLFLKDQKAALQYGICNRDSLYAIYFSNAKKLHNLYVTYGIPNFLLKKDEYYLKYWVILRHYFGMKNIISDSEEFKSEYSFMNFDSLKWKKNLFEELKDGNITPQFYSQVISYHDSNNPYGKCAIRLNFNTNKVELFTPLSKIKSDLINKNRNDIGLYPIVESNSDFLKTTWYAYYPFEEIKKAFIECDSCFTDSDYYDLLYKVEKQAKTLYVDHFSSKGYLLDDYRNLKERWVEGLNKYKKNKPTNASCIKPKY
ncbi:MAG: hypothetical protein ACPKQO_00955 [Nitrososphaeraceae archaeon]